MLSPQRTAHAVGDLIARAAALAAGPGRRILGIAGAPGAGKTTLAETLVAGLGGRAVCVGLDGFHLADEELDRLGTRDRKGAPDTFDVHGYLALLRRLRSVDEPVVYAARFDRYAEAAIAGAVPVHAAVPLVITEGNWLLDPQPPWDAVRGLLDEAWFVTVSEDDRLARLVTRHETHGRSPEAARAWAHGPDQHNAQRVVGGVHRADLQISLGWTAGSPNHLCVGCPKRQWRR